MNSRTNRDAAHRQGVTWFDCSINARLNLVASFQAFRGQDVTAFTVFVQNQRDVRGTVSGSYSRTFNNCRDTVFVAFEVNNTVSLLVATTDMTSGDTAIVVTTTGFAVFSNGAKGLPLCSSGLTTLTTWRRPGDVGLHLTTCRIFIRLTQRRQRSPDSGLLSG